MTQSIADIRKDYSKQSMDAEELSSDPIDQFKKWFSQAIDAKVLEPNAMNLATHNANGGVSSRIVLIKDIDDDGIVFYTNYESEKGLQMLKNQQVAVNFFWPELERQVRLEGVTSKVSDERSTIYFNSRPRASQIGAWVSPQSNIIASRVYLEERQRELEEKYTGREIPRPKHWGGYKISMTMIEFWQGRPSRLHDRIRYQLIHENWKMDRLAP
ncbi:MAG: pyridoxamine 5'-phosphate oxidase [Marivirga sp.]|jgi:pyridoxamine 5'-phosphate oxidase